MPRDDDGKVVFAGVPEEEARASVNRLGERLFPRLSGFSVRPKTFVLSDFVSQQYICGYYFPFTMEANINGRMEALNKPFTMCHELAHTHGYLYEDEANLIGFLACLTSGDPAFVYSGYLGVLYYVDNDFVHEAADTFIDQNQKLNGISAGKAAYTHVVGLLLSYYAGNASYLSR